MSEIPTGRDPWFLIALTPGIDQATFFARGGKFENNVWNYDGVNHTDAFGGGSPTHTWIPKDHTLINGRYGYIGSGFRLLPLGGSDVPVIYLSSIPHYENSYLVVDPSEQPAHDINADVNYFKRGILARH